eukprot:UN01933
MSMLLLSLLFVVSKSAVPAQYGPYGKTGCTHKEITIGGFVAGGSQNAVLAYPTKAINDGTTLPFVAFAHGMTAGGNKVWSSYGTVIEEVCSYGYIIVAAQSCSELYCQRFYEDVITTIKTCSSKKGDLDKALGYADFRKIGVYGHSMGGAATVHVSDQTNLNIVASAPLHPSVVDDSDKSESRNVACPTLWFTGSSDTTVPPNGVYTGWTQDKTLPKVFAEIKGATHNNHVNNEGPYVAKFFDCLIKGESAACNYFKPGLNYICSGGMSMTRCYVNGTVGIDSELK